jgi:UDP-glucose 6-dehydrogenase
LEPNGIFDALPELDLFDPKEKTCLIIDDFEFEKCSKATMQRLSTIYRYVSSHKNLSVMTGYQSFFETPSIIRKCSNVFLIYKPTASNELSMIANRVGLDPDDMKHIFKHICNGVYDSLMIDNTICSPARLRKNVFQKIELNDSSSDDEE